MYLFDPTYLLLFFISVVLGLATQAYVNNTFRALSDVPLATGLTGAEVARRMLDAEGLRDVRIEQVGGQLTDNYDPRTRVLNLSPNVYAGRSVAAAGVASHEAGHAVQHARAFAPARLRASLVPAANLGSQLALPLVFLGFWINVSGLITLGIVLFGLAVAFQLVTLPVEFDASKRALASLSTAGMLPPDQVAGARRVLTAAALTYVAAALVSVLYFLWLLRRR